MSQPEEIFETVTTINQIRKLVNKSSYTFVRITIDRDSSDIRLFMEDFDESTKSAFALKNIDESEQSRAFVKKEVPALTKKELVAKLKAWYEKWIADAKELNNDQNMSCDIRSSLNSDPVLEVFNCNDFSLETVVDTDKIDELLIKSSSPFVRITVKLNQIRTQICMENFEGTRKTAFALKPTDKSERLGQIDENVSAMTKKELVAQLTKVFKKWCSDSTDFARDQIKSCETLPSKETRDVQKQTEQPKEQQTENRVPETVPQVVGEPQNKEVEQPQIEDRSGKIREEDVNIEIIKQEVEENEPGIQITEAPQKTHIPIETAEKHEFPLKVVGEEKLELEVARQSIEKSPIFLKEKNSGKQLLIEKRPSNTPQKTIIEETQKQNQKLEKPGSSPMKQRLGGMSEEQNELTKKMREEAQGKAQKENLKCVIARLTKIQAKQIEDKEQKNGDQRMEVNVEAGVTTHPMVKIPSLENIEKDIEQENRKVEISRQLSILSETMTDDKPGTSRDRNSLTDQHMKNTKEQIARKETEPSPKPVKRKASTVRTGKRGRPSKITKEDE